MNRAAQYGTMVVLLHLAINLAHGSAHQRLSIELGRWEWAFVTVVILIAPVVASILLWTSRRRFGLKLLVLSMAASFIFGLCEHFFSAGPDNISHHGQRPWEVAFALTAWLLLVIEAVGVWVAVFFLRRPEIIPEPR